MDIDKYRDGILHLCKQKTKKNELGQIIPIENDLDIVYSRFFKKKRVSNTDKEIAFQNDYNIDFVASIPIDYLEFDSTYLVLIKDNLYEIKNIYEDYDKRTADIVLGKRSKN